jgi:hypothetical protein
MKWLVLPCSIALQTLSLMQGIQLNHTQLLTTFDADKFYRHQIKCFSFKHLKEILTHSTLSTLIPPLLYLEMSIHVLSIPGICRGCLKEGKLAFHCLPLATFGHNYFKIPD